MAEPGIMAVLAKIWSIISIPALGVMGFMAKEIIQLKTRISVQESELRNIKDDIKDVKNETREFRKETREMLDKIHTEVRHDHGKI